MISQDLEWYDQWQTFEVKLFLQKGNVLRVDHLRQQHSIFIEEN